MTTEIDTSLRAAEQQRCAAMLANDNAALDALLDDRLHFAHANGGVDDKAAYLAKMAAGRIQYVGISWSEDAITVLADAVAMMTGRMTTDVKVDGVDKCLENRVTTIWCRNSGKWQLTAFQSTPLAA